MPRTRRPENRKIMNASPLEFEGISFKSQLEKMAYQTLRENGLPAEYESRKFIIWEGFKPTVPFYNRDNSTRMLKLDNKKLVDCSYTPDFTFEYKGYLVILELKGFENNIFPLKKKMFRRYLEEHHPKSVFFEVYTKKQLLQAIYLIKTLE